MHLLLEWATAQPLGDNFDLLGEEEQRQGWAVRDLGGDASGITADTILPMTQLPGASLEW